VSYQRLVRGLKVGICTVGFQEKCENKLVVTEITTSSLRRLNVKNVLWVLHRVFVC